MGIWETQDPIHFLQLLEKLKIFSVTCGSILHCEHTDDQLPYMSVWISNEYFFQQCTTNTEHVSGLNPVGPAFCDESTNHCDMIQPQKNKRFLFKITTNQSLMMLLEVLPKFNNEKCYNCKRQINTE